MRIVSAGGGVQLGHAADYGVFGLPRGRRKNRVFVYQNIKFSTKSDSLISYMRSYELWANVKGFAPGENLAKIGRKR